MSNVKGKRLKGFTLVELLLVIAIVAILAGVSFPYYSKILFRNSLSISNQAISQSLRRAQLLSQSGQSDSQWGIYAQANSLTLFSGATYATRDSSLDELHNLSEGIVLTGDTEIVFEKFTGELVVDKLLTLTLDNEEVNIYLNTKGMVGNTAP